MQKRAQVILKTKKAEAVERFHPWVFSGAIKKIEGQVANGDVVDVYSNKLKYLATGHYSNGSIAVRLFSWGETEAGREFWKQRMKKAWQLRRQLFPDPSVTNAYRLVFAEGDRMPGMIVDVYEAIVVFQAYSEGMHKLKSVLVEFLQEYMGERLKAVYDKSPEMLQRQNGETSQNGFILGEQESAVVMENGYKFHVNVAQGQKTGFYLDQRDNRRLLFDYARDKTVLNVFAYSGGFSVFALAGRAKQVVSVDSSKKAIGLAEENIELNGFPREKHHALTMDAMDYLKEMNEDQYDIIVLDPPAFAKSKHSRHNAVQGYKRINAKALEKIKAGGLLFTFSCSRMVDRRLFNDTVMAAAIQTGREVSVLHMLSQPADHPVSIYHPEGAYLKGLVLRVE